MTENPAVREDDPKRPRKAIASTILSALAAFVAFWIADTDPFTVKEAAQGVLLALVSSGLVGGATFAVRNPKRWRNLDERGEFNIGNAALFAFVALVIGAVIYMVVS